MGDIILEDFFDRRTIKPVKRERLIKALRVLKVKYCPQCSNRLKFTSTAWNTNTYCSRKCSWLATLKKVMQTNLKKYWVKNVSQSKTIQDRIKSNNLKKHWVTNTSKLQSSRDKTKKTNLKKYWVESHFQNQEIKDNIIKTNLKKYWVNHCILLKSSRDNLKKIQQEKLIKENKNIEIIKWWYIYNCFICNKKSTYIKAWNRKTNFIQRVRLWFLPCEKCTSNKWINQRSWIEIILENELNNKWVKTEHKQELDIFLPDYNLAIEINWIYWHSDKFKDKNYHKNKLLKFKKQWIQILSFTDKEIIENKDKIINYILGKTNNIKAIGASKCKIREIDTKTAKKFCETTHIHWYAWGNKKYWLFYKEKLVSVCVVWKNRFNKGNSLEIIRLANSCKIIWWFWRFLKIIKLDFPQTTQIDTFIDAFLWLSKENIFTRYWFTFIKHTSPNYKWILKWKVISRQNTQKHKLLEKWYKWETENSIMMWLWAHKIYDAWNYKFTLI